MKDLPPKQVDSEFKPESLTKKSKMDDFTALSGQLRMAEVWSEAFTPEFVILLSPYYGVEIPSNRWKAVD